MAHRHVPPSEIAARLGRDKSTVTRRLGHRAKPLVKQGRKAIVTDEQMDEFEKRLDEMIVKAAGDYQTTYEMVRRCCRLKCGVLEDRIYSSILSGEIGSLKEQAGHEAKQLTN